jgi:hypothetical protein
MARLIVRHVRRQLEAIRDTSQRLKHLLHSTLKAMEANPSAFEELKEIPAQIRAIPGVTVRKTKITHGAHDYRLVFLHFRPDEGEEWSEVIYAFRRREGYPLDWDWIEGLLGGR